MNLKLKNHHIDKNVRFDFCEKNPNQHLALYVDAFYMLTDPKPQARRYFLEVVLPSFYS